MGTDEQAAEVQADSESDEDPVNAWTVRDSFASAWTQKRARGAIIRNFAISFGQGRDCQRYMEPRKDFRPSSGSRASVGQNPNGVRTWNSAEPTPTRQDDMVELMKMRFKYYHTHSDGVTRAHSLSEPLSTTKRKSTFKKPLYLEMCNHITLGCDESCVPTNSELSAHVNAPEPPVRQPLGLFEDAVEIQK